MDMLIDDHGEGRHVEEFAVRHIRIVWEFVVFWLIGLAILVAVWLYASSGAPVVAAEPMATATPTPSPPLCELVAQAHSIKIYYCEDIHLFVNDLGFMAFEP